MDPIAWQNISTVLLNSIVLHGITLWWNFLVLATKKSGEVRICVDYCLCFTLSCKFHCWGNCSKRWRSRIFHQVRLLSRFGRYHFTRKADTLLLPLHALVTSSTNSFFGLSPSPEVFPTVYKWTRLRHVNMSTWVTFLYTQRHESSPVSSILDPKKH